MSEIFVNKEDYDYLVEIKEEFKNTVEKLENEMIKNIKLKQTLADIKEIIYYNKTNRLSGGVFISIEQILHKISEVKDEV